MRFWFVALMVLSAALLLSDIVIIAVTATVGRSSAYFSYSAVIEGVQSQVTDAIDKILQPMVLCAETVAQADPTLRICNLPLTANSSNGGGDLYDPSTLIAIQNGYSETAGAASWSSLQSLGILTAYGAQNPTQPEDFTNKESWEVALGFGCPAFIYGYTDASLAYYGYCAWPNFTIDYSRLAYLGTDYGLAPAEQQLMAGNVQAIFLPVFDLLGSFSLTYERAYRCNQSEKRAYAATFAEKGLSQLDAAMTTLQIGLGGRAYVVEASTGLMITASVPGQTFNNKNTTSQRVNASAAPDYLIRQSAQHLLASEGSFSTISGPVHYEFDGFAVDARPYSYAPAGASLGWLQITVIVESDYVAYTRSSVGVAVLASVVTGIGVLVVVGVLLYSCAKRMSVHSLGEIEEKLLH